MLDFNRSTVASHGDGICCFQYLWPFTTRWKCFYYSSPNRCYCCNQLDYSPSLSTRLSQMKMRLESAKSTTGKIIVVVHVPQTIKYQWISQLETNLLRRRMVSIVTRMNRKTTRIFSIATRMVGRVTKYQNNQVIHQDGHCRQNDHINHHPTRIVTMMIMIVIRMVRIGIVTNIVRVVTKPPGWPIINSSSVLRFPKIDQQQSSLYELTNL